MRSIETGRLVRRGGSLAVSLLVATLGPVAGAAAPEPRTEPGPVPDPGATEVERRDDRFGVLVMAHGGTPEWNEAVRRAVAALPHPDSVEIAFGMADADSMQEAVRRLEKRGVRDVAVVRLFVSGESWYDRTRRTLGLEPGAPGRPRPAAAARHDESAERGRPHRHERHDVDGAGHHGRDHDSHGAHRPEPATHHAAGGGAWAGHSMAYYRLDTSCRFALSREGLADAPEVEQVLVERARALSRDPAREDVLLLAHGPGDDGENARWVAAIDARADVLRRTLGFHSVAVETLREDWPDKRAEAERRIRDRVRASLEAGRRPIVIPFRVYGFGPYREVLEGLDYVADGRGLLPHPAIEGWIARQIDTLRRELAAGG